MRRALAALLALSTPLAACGAEGARTPNATRPLAEDRAVEIVRKSLARAGLEPSAGRDAKLANGKPIHVDVGVAGREVGIVFLTKDDAAQLGSAIPPRDEKSDALRIVRLAESEARVVVLYQEAYLYDDLAGDAHAETTIACEHRLERDVSDFAAYAKSKGLK